MKEFMNRNFLKGSGFVLACIFCAVLMYGLCGCSSQAVNPRGQTTEICAVGLPVVAWISHVSQDAEHVGSDTNIVSQANTQSFSGEIQPTEPAK